MLRQIWRQRGAYNVVNLPFAASQDDPGSSTGRADRSADWRRHYNPALEPEFREDVGLEAWDRPNWYSDQRLSSTAAAKILRKRLETYGPQKERSLQEVISRIRSEKDAVIALKAAELFRRYRSSREQHAPFKNSTSKMIVQRALEVDAGEVAVQALARKDELGFNFISLKAYRQAITHFSTKGDLKNVLKVFDLAKKQGLKPNRDISFCILRACLDCGRADMAYAYAVEFQENGLRISPAQKIIVEAEAGKMLPPHPHGNDPSESHEGADADTPSASVAAAVSEQADRIIAAASSGAPLPKGESGISSDELTGSVSTTGEPEAVVEAGKVVPEIAISQGKVAAESPFVGGQKVAAAFSVEPDDVIGAVTKASAAGTCSAETMGLKYDEVPGLEAAVAAKMRMLFPPKPERQEPPDLRRANSI